MTLGGSRASWPVGLLEASQYPVIALVEGGPDLLAAFDLILKSGVKKIIAPVAMLGASLSIPDDALPLFEGKRVRIFPHTDANEAGTSAARRWAGQLQSVAMKVDGYAFAYGDLNDFAVRGNGKHKEAMTY